MDEKLQVYAVIRIDRGSTMDAVLGWPDDISCPMITVKEILPTLEEARDEVERLNQLQAEKGCHYYVETTRYFPNGRPSIQ